MKMHNDPHSWQGWLELFQSWWRGDTPLGAVLMSLFMAGLRIAYFGGSGGWKKKTLEILLCGALTLTFSSALEYFGCRSSSHQSRRCRKTGRRHRGRDFPGRCQPDEKRYR